VLRRGDLGLLLRGVPLEGKRSIKKLIKSTAILGSDQIEHLARILAIALPPR
jgi:hypothetical protein